MPHPDYRYILQELDVSRLDSSRRLCLHIGRDAVKLVPDGVRNGIELFVSGPPGTIVVPVPGGIPGEQFSDALAPDGALSPLLFGIQTGVAVLDPDDPKPRTLLSTYGYICREKLTDVLRLRSEKARGKGLFGWFR